MMDENADLGAAAWAGGAAVTFMKSLATKGICCGRGDGEEDGEDGSEGTVILQGNYARNISIAVR